MSIFGGLFLLFTAVVLHNENIIFLKRSLKNLEEDTIKFLKCNDKFRDQLELPRTCVNVT